MSNSMTQMKELENRAYKVNIKRSDIEIIYCILKACEKRERSPRILRKARITRLQWEDHNFLIKDGYLREETFGPIKFYHLDKKGRKYIRNFDKFREYVNDPNILPEENIKLGEIPEPKQKPPYLVYHEKLSTMLRKLSEIDSKKVRKVVRSFNDFIPSPGGYGIGIDDRLAITMNIGKRIALNIWSKDPDSTNYSRIYSLNRFPPEVLAYLPKYIKDKVMKTLEEVEKRSRDTTLRKFKSVKTLELKQPPEPKKISEQSIKSKEIHKEVTLIRPPITKPDNEQTILNEAAKFLDEKMTPIKRYQREDIENFLRLIPQITLSPHNLFDKLKRTGTLREYIKFRQSYYELKKQPEN